ncbi:MAG: hypothetical protein ACFCUN_05030 [Hyphomicrobiaceae bacterium]
MTVAREATAAIETRPVETLAIAPPSAAGRSAADAVPREVEEDELSAKDAHPDIDSVSTQRVRDARTVAKTRTPVITRDGAADGMTMAVFLDRLMIAESSGRDDARNPRSTATGPYQFIRSTFLAVMRRHFQAKIEGLDEASILALRTDRAIARAAAEAYTLDNGAVLVEDGHAPSFPNLRLAFLLGAGGASRVLAMDPDAPVAPVLGAAVIRANPFLARMTARDLIARAAADIDLPPSSESGVARAAVQGRATASRAPAEPQIKIACNLARPSCKRWVALERAKLRASPARKRQRTAARASNR